MTVKNEITLNKCQIILHIYDSLLNHKKIEINSTITEFNISVRTFRRYIAEINAYLYNNYKNQYISYKKSIQSYCLVDINE